MTRRAAEKFKAGDEAGACADAKAALAHNPNLKQAFGISQLTCRDHQVQATLSAQVEDKRIVPPPSSRGKEASIGKAALSSRAFLLGGDGGLSRSGAGLKDLLSILSTLKAQGKFGEVISKADEGLKTLPDNTLLLNSKSFAQLRIKDYKGALITVDRAIKVDPKSAAAHGNKAYALGATGDRDGMIAELKTAASLDPQFKAALDKALAASSAGLFDFPDAGRALPAPDDKGKGGGNAEAAKWVVIGVLGLPIVGLIFFLALRKRSARTPIAKPSWPEALSAAPTSRDRLQGKYELGPQIGAGGMGMVFEGTDTSLKRKVAIKKMLPQLAAQPKLRERFIAEARTVAALHHPNIVDIYAIMEENEDLYLVFEHVAGKTLAELIASRGRYPFPDALKIIRDIAAAVEFAHGQGIIHRDLKPANVMINEAGRVVVMDFGLARTVQDLMSKAALTNTIVGTPAYMAPEQEEGVVCKQSDVYSLAVCLYELLAAKRPFDGSPAAMLASKAALKYAPISSLVTGLPAGLDIFFTCALAADPKKRPASPTEFVAALDAMTPVPNLSH